jgi:hypothetical protein
MLRKLLAALCVTTVTGCSSLDVDHYRAEKPMFQLEEYFNGQIEAWGMFQKRSGEVVKRFKVDIDARWQGNKGVLDEQFVYSDGTTQQRIWRITKTGENEYIGTAGDVIGEAQGRAAGNALRWRYTLSLPVDDKVYEVQFDDWMYLMDDGVLMNRSVMKKFGFTLGEVILFFRKQP